MANVTMLVSTRYNGAQLVADSTHPVDDDTAARWARNGIAVTVDEKPPEKMSVAELEAFAAAHGIDLAGAEKKEDKLARIQAAQA